MKNWLFASMESFLRSRGFVPVAELRAEKSSGLAALKAEQAHHAETRRERDDSRAFIDKQLQPLTVLEPVMRWPKPNDQSPSYDVEPFAVANARVMEFIEGKRKDIVIRVAIPAVFDYWNSPFRQDIRTVDEAIGYVAKAAAHKITQTLRFGLTGDRP